MSLVDRLISFAQQTPYFHLDGYMNRWWLVPFDTGYKIGATQQFGGGTERHGCGPLNPLRRPFSRLIQKCGIAARIHQILRSDRGRDPHNHPWNYLTIILRGGYWEARYDDHGNELSFKWHGPGSILWRPANTYHRLILQPAGPGHDHTVWTLFITFRRTGKSWGFIVDGKYVPYQQYQGEV